MKQLKQVWSFLEGKKTYIAGIAAIIYGLITGEEEMIFTGLGFLGLRMGLNSEVRKLIRND